MNSLVVSRILKVAPRHPLVNLSYVFLGIQTRCVFGKNQELTTEKHFRTTLIHTIKVTLVTEKNLSTSPYYYGNSCLTETFHKYTFYRSECCSRFLRFDVGKNISSIMQSRAKT